MIPKPNRNDLNATGEVFTVKEVEPRIRFAERFPENMRNAAGSYFPFRVEVTVRPSP